MKATVALDHPGIAEALRSTEIRRTVHELAEDVAAAARRNVHVHGGEAPVVVDDFTTDRAGASVTIAHPAGLALQAKHGTLTRAASANGLTVVTRRQLVSRKKAQARRAAKRKAEGRAATFKDRGVQ